MLFLFLTQILGVKQQQIINHRNDSPSPLDASPRSPPSEPCAFAVGDVVWAKTNLHPWWPCMISTPNLSNATNSRQAQKSFNETTITSNEHTGDSFIRYMNASRRHKRMLFVEFYGPVVEHAWAIESNILAYTGICPKEFFKGKDFKFQFEINFQF